MRFSYTRYSVSQGLKKVKTRAALAISAVGLLAGSGGMAFAVIGGAHAATPTVVVTGNTSSGYDQPGWMFNRDSATSTPFEFNTDAHSIGVGSLYVEPISSTPADKFVAEDFYMGTIDSFNSFSYDFQEADAPLPTGYKQFYLNVYVNLPGQNPDNFYDCRFDYVPTSGSTSSFTTFTVDKSTTPTVVAAHATCPTTLGGLASGSTIRAFAINVGDTSASDAGLAGYLDKVVVNNTSDVITYDFEPALKPSGKTDCMQGNWTTFNSPAFSNQGQCVAYANHHNGVGQDDNHASNR